MDDHIHIGHCPGLGDIFLTEQFEGYILGSLGCRQFRLHSEFALDKETTGTASGIIDFHSWIRGEDASHDLPDFTWGIEFAGALAAAFSEFTDEVFVTFAYDVCFYVLKPKALGADGLNEVG